MKERPILFSAPMIRPILAGTKTQTRRLINPVGNDDGFVLRDYGDGFWPYRSEDGESGFYRDRDGYDMEERIKCPHGQRGDRLWIREAWQYYDWTDDGEPLIRYAADNATAWPETSTEEWGEKLQDVWAALSMNENYAIDMAARDRRWRPSIHMPRWASRITLEVTGVKVERLQDISEADAMAEGIVSAGDGNGFQLADTTHYMGAARDSYASLWQSINGPGSWDANPWVWCVSFLRVSPNTQTAQDR